jgi:hypothetical protein
MPPEDPYYDDVVTPIRNTPHANVEAERSLIASLIAEPHQAGALTDLVDPDDFYEPRHETIWHAVTNVLNDGLLPDVPTLLKQLRTTGDLTTARLHDYTLQTTGAHPGQATSYARTIHETALSRRATSQISLAHAHALSATTTDQVADALSRAMDAVETGLRTLWSDGRATTTLHADLTGILTDGIPQPDPPAYCRRQDGHALFYPARVNGLYGDPESAKSWIAQVGVVEVLAAGGRATIIDVDHNGPAATSARLAHLGADPATIANPDHFRYYEPDDRDELLATVTQAVDWNPHIAILDSLGELLPMYGASSVDNDEITEALRRLANPLANAGACVITIDHLPKNADARTSGYAIGGTAKKRAMDGALIHVDTKTPAAPGQTGRMVLRIEKDRPGRLRETSSGKYAGTFILDSTRDQIVATIDLETVPTDAAGTRRYTIFMEKISRHVEDNDQASFNDICDAVGGNEKQLRAAITTLIDEGFMTTFPGPRRSKLHHSIAHYREAEDDHA